MMTYRYAFDTTIYHMKACNVNLMRCLSVKYADLPESNKINICLEKAYHRQKFNCTIRFPSLRSIHIPIFDERGIYRQARRSDQARRHVAFQFKKGFF